MKKAYLALFLLLLFSFSSMNVFGFELFKKKYDKEEKENDPMVHTVQEWLESGTNVKMDLRKRDEDIGKKDENLIPPTAEIPSYLELYNIKPGSKELNLSSILKTKTIRSPFVSNPEVSLAAYTESHYYPQTRQIASTLYLINLDGHLGKKERLQDVSIFEHTRYPLISTALPYLREGFFSSLTVVDFSKDGKKILVKEKRGSNKYGLYETFVWIYYITDESREYSQSFMNNLDFSNSMQNAPVTDFSDGTYGELGGDLSNLSDVPPYSIGGYDNGYAPNAANGSYDGGSVGNNDYIKGFGSKNGQIDNDWMRENVANVDASDYGVKTYADNGDMPKLSADDIRGFIKTNWKYQEMTSPTKTRWYNEIPVDFRVDDSYDDTKENIGYGVRLNLLNEMIKAYWFDRQNLILNHIRWDLKPLGFNAQNSDEIIVLAFAYTKENKKVSLGRWAVNINDGLPRLVLDDEAISIEANGLVLVNKLNPR